MKILVQDSGGGLRRLDEGYASEQELQSFLKSYPDDDIALNAPPWPVSRAARPLNAVHPEHFRQLVRKVGVR